MGIRGDHDNKTGKSSQISQAIVSAIQIQGKDSTDQNADLLEAIKTQNTLLENLTEVLSKNPFRPTTGLPPPGIQQARALSLRVDEDEDEEENCFHRTEESLRACEDTKRKAKEVVEEDETCFHYTEESMRAHEVETARNRSATENSAMVQDYYNPKKSETTTGALPGETGVFAALDNADSDEEEAAAAAAQAAAAQSSEPIQRQPRGPSATAVAVPEPAAAKTKKGGKKVITGPWAFVETSVALKRRGRVENSEGGG